MNLWSEDEVILALEYFYCCPENTHTDSHAGCKKMAAILGRSPGALDKISRNIKSAVTGSAGLSNASNTIRQLARKYKRNKAALLRDAARVRDSRGLPSLTCE
jgi:hypothetical protein